MHNTALILVAQAVSVYLLVLFSHSMRQRAGLGPFYALLGGLTAIMSWLTDAGVQVQMAGLTFMVGSTVYYTALLLGIFVVYVFDGPRSTCIAILAVAGLSILTPIAAAVLHAHVGLPGFAALRDVPRPSLRINTASVVATIADMVLLAMAWEVLGRSGFRRWTWLRVFVALLGVMWLDVFLFATGAFAGTPHYLAIMRGTLATRLVVCSIAFPFLYVYIDWQTRRAGPQLENRPVLAILRQFSAMRAELDVAQAEIRRRELAEAALRASEEHYRGLFENSLDAVALHEVVWNDQGRPVDYIFRAANPAFERHTSLRVPDILGRRVTDVQPGILETDLIETYAKVAASGEPITLDLFFAPSQRHYTITAYQVGSGRFATVFRDVTDAVRQQQERASLQTQLAKAQKLESIGRLAGGMAHELNNLLTPILGYADMILTTLPDRSPQQEPVRQIVQAARKARDLVRQLMAFGRQQILRASPLDVNALIARVAARLQRTLPTSIALRVSTAPELPAVRADAEQIDLVLMNLVGNAQEAMPNGGELTLRTTAINLDQAAASAYEGAVAGQYVVLEVTDTGCGIEPDLLPLIFEPFFTTKGTGTRSGLGLASVHGIVKQHGGCIAVQSSAGRGTVFTILLPVGRADDGQSPASA